MAKTTEEKISGWLKNGFTANTKSLPTHFEDLILYVDLSMSLTEIRGLAKVVGDDYTFSSSDLDELLNTYNTQFEDPAAIRVEFGTHKDYPRISEAYASFVANPKILGVVTDSTILHQKPGFECNEVKWSREKSPTYFGRTKVKAPFVMENNG